MGEWCVCIDVRIVFLYVCYVSVIVCWWVVFVLGCSLVV